jgi:hypothetical protein
MFLVKNSEIQAGLDKCNEEVNAALNLFQVSPTLFCHRCSLKDSCLQMHSHIFLHQSQREATEIMRSNTAEMRDLLYQILTSQQEIRNVAEMQYAGEHVAEPIMAAGQLVGCFVVALRWSDSNLHRRKCANCERIVLASSFSVNLYLRPQ